jgi:CBS domain-containing protein
MADETQCPNCGATLESDEEICSACEATVESVKSPSRMAPPPPPVATGVTIPTSEPIPKVVGDIMTRKLATLFEGESLEEAEKGFRKVRFRHVPVISPNGFLIGLLSLRDLLRVLPSPLEPDSEDRKAVLLAKYRVGDILARNVTSVSADTTLEEAGTLMIDQKRDCLPVTDDSGNLVGLVTATDFIRLALTFLKNAP